MCVVPKISEPADWRENVVLEAKNTMWNNRTVSKPSLHELGYYFVT
jgi:hypothetical protein